MTVSLSKITHTYTHAHRGWRGIAYWLELTSSRYLGCWQSDSNLGFWLQSNENGVHESITNQINTLISALLFSSLLSPFLPPFLHLLSFTFLFANTDSSLGRQWPSRCSLANQESLRGAFELFLLLLSLHL